MLVNFTFLYSKVENTLDLICFNVINFGNPGIESLLYENISSMVTEEPVLVMIEFISGESKSPLWSTQFIEKYLKPISFQLISPSDK